MHSTAVLDYCKSQKISSMKARSDGKSVMQIITLFILDKQVARPKPLIARPEDVVKNL